MKILSPVKYQARDAVKTFAYYYLAMFIVLLLNIVMLLTLSDGSVHYSYEMCTLGVAFIFGLCTFTENFKMLLQNGVSRRAFFVSRVLVMLAIIFAATAVEQLLYVVSNFITARMPDFEVTSMFGDASGARSIGSIALTFGLYTMACSLGSVTNLVYYRLGKFGKILVSVGVPVVLFIVFPVLDSMVFRGALFSAIIKFFKAVFASGVSTGLVFLVITALALTLSWLLMRRAVVKEK